MINADKLLRLCINACSISVNAKTHLSLVLCGIAAGNKVIKYYFTTLHHISR